eukprot:3010033-Alexandrium_andersonii.AAC.1
MGEQQEDAVAARGGHAAREQDAWQAWASKRQREGHQAREPDPLRGARDRDGAFLVPKWEAYSRLARVYQREGGRLEALRALRHSVEVAL